MISWQQTEVKRTKQNIENTKQTYTIQPVLLRLLDTGLDWIVHPYLLLKYIEGIELNVTVTVSSLSLNRGRRFSTTLGNDANRTKLTI